MENAEPPAAETFRGPAVDVWGRPPDPSMGLRSRSGGSSPSSDRRVPCVRRSMFGRRSGPRPLVHGAGAGRDAASLGAPRMHRQIRSARTLCIIGPLSNAGRVAQAVAMMGTEMPSRNALPPLPGSERIGTGSGSARPGNDSCPRRTLRRCARSLGSGRPALQFPAILPRRKPVLQRGSGGGRPATDRAPSSCSLA